MTDKPKTIIPVLPAIRSRYVISVHSNAMDCGNSLLAMASITSGHIPCQRPGRLRRQ